MKTKADVLAADYNVDERGIIRSPGKFEGEPIYAPVVYDAMLDGCLDELCWPDERVTWIFEVDDEFRKEFSIDAEIVAISFGERDTGFVDTAQLTQKDLDELNEANETEWDNQTEEDE